MSKIRMQAIIRATSKPGMTIERAVAAAEADLAQLRHWLEQDPQTPYCREVGYRLISIGQYLAQQGRPR